MITPMIENKSRITVQSEYVNIIYPFCYESKSDFTWRILNMVILLKRNIRMND